MHMYADVYFMLHCFMRMGSQSVVVVYCRSLFPKRDGLNHVTLLVFDIT